MEKIVELYIRTSCPSSRKAQKNLDNNRVPYRVHYVNEVMSTDFVKELLTRTTMGANQILKKGVKGKYDNLPLSTLIKDISEDPTLVTTPIIVQGEGKINIGYNKEEITMFYPREEKQRVTKALVKAI